jgi:hypothetical protein
VFLEARNLLRKDKKMAQTHEDRDARFDWQRLEKRADDMVANRLSEITAGAPGETVLDAYKYDGIYVTRRPADEQGVARISIGAGTIGDSRKMRYCVFRGSPEVCAALLEEAVHAIRQDSGASR